jgi:hypothetical protein
MKRIRQQDFSMTYFMVNKDVLGT